MDLPEGHGNIVAVVVGTKAVWKAWSVGDDDLWAGAKEQKAG